MLIDVESGKVIEQVPFRRDFDVLRGRLSDADFEAMVTRINDLIDASGAEIATAGWLPGSDWDRHSVRADLHDRGTPGLPAIRAVLRPVGLVRGDAAPRAVGLRPLPGRRARHRQPHLLPVVRLRRPRHPSGEPRGRSVTLGVQCGCTSTRFAEWSSCAQGQPAVHVSTGEEERKR